MATAVDFNIGKTGGAFRTDYNLSLMSDTYDPNDMGYIRRNNELEHSVDFSYNVYEPKGSLMMQRYSLDFSYNQLYNPRAFTSSAIELGSMIVFMNYWSLSLDAMVYTPGVRMTTMSPGPMTCQCIITGLPAC
ncbi:MAG: DUF5916 domain-containing protein [Marinilabiliales bacterium]|nr:DUF5916 domain-containing protein [Marinilabiliales bacterium]